MRLEKFIDEDILIENIIMKNLKKLFNKPAKKVMMIFQDSFRKFIKIIRQNDVESEVLKILNKHAGKNYKSLEQILKSKPLTESEELNEDWSHFWDTIKSEAFPALSFYPALTAWLEIDKLIKGSDASIKAIVIYAIIWLFLISGKFIKQFYKWKKENPEEYMKERPKKRKKIRDMINGPKETRLNIGIPHSEWDYDVPRKRMK